MQRDIIIDISAPDELSVGLENPDIAVCHQSQDSYALTLFKRDLIERAGEG
jgi:hypothetical protein